MSKHDIAEELAQRIYGLVGELQSTGQNVTNLDVHCACLAVIAGAVGEESDHEIRELLLADLAARLKHMVATTCPHPSTAGEAIQ